jgi:hypothetical protein
MAPGGHRRAVPAAGISVLRFDFSYVSESEGCFEELTVARSTTLSGR